MGRIPCRLCCDMITELVIMYVSVTLLSSSYILKIEVPFLES